MNNYSIKLVGSHLELKNHVPKTAVFLSYPQSGNIVLLGLLFYKISDVIHFANDDQKLPMLLVKFIENQPNIED